MMCYMSTVRRLCPVVVLFWGCVFVQAAETQWLGAEAALKQLEETDPAAAASEGDANLDAGEQLDADIDSYEQVAGSLEPDEAATQWLALLDRYLAMKSEGEDAGSEYGGYGGYGGYGYGRRSSRTDSGPTFKRLLEVIPPPASWEAIRVGIDARPAPADNDQAMGRHHALRLWGCFLVNDGPGVQRELEALSTFSRQVNMHERYAYTRLLETLVEYLDAGADGQSGLVEQFEQELAEAEGGEDIWGIDVPDLVTLVGEERATALLERVFVLDIDGISVDEGEETKALARRIVIEQIDLVKQPCWGLVDTIDAVDLYEALAGKFLPDGGKPAPAPQAGADTGEGAAPHADAEPASDTAAKGTGLGLSSIARGLRSMMSDDYDDMRENPYDDYEYQNARQYYVLGLIALGRAEDAKLELRTQRGDKAWSLDLPYMSLGALDQAGYTEGVYKFLHLMLTEDPSLPVWAAYTELAVRMGMIEPMLELATASAAREDLPKDVRGRLRTQLVDALLAADRLDDALSMIRSVLAENPRSPEAIKQFIELGVALRDPALIAEAIVPARAAAIQDSPADRTGIIPVLITGYLEAGRHAEAERFLIDYMRKHFAGREDAQDPMLGYYGEGEATYMNQLLLVYAEAGRHADLLYLLDHWDGWGVADLAALRQNYSVRGISRVPLNVHVARALHAVGKTPEAEALIMATLDENPGSDPAYELLVTIKGADAIGALDALFERDQFEERPLIWKAALLADQGRVDEAEAVIKRAIAIDPSDGEQGRGDRMRAYRVLGRIARAKGDAEQAAFLQQVDDAIRLSEDADRVYAAGMYKRGIEMYKRSLDSFADAYCIQSRLAIQLSAQGRHEEAEIHYQRAYELMPDSFGRVESHCFGCEGVFSDDRAQGVAERIFSRLIEERPDSPQVHYLMGYLRSSQGDYAEAARHYQRAVELDPEYLNAWERLASSAKYAGQPAEFLDRVYLNIVRLDPLGRHSYDAADRIIDIRALWPILEANRAYYTAKPESLYRLEASANKLESVQKLMAGDFRRMYQSRFGSERDHDQADTPGKILARHTVFEGVTELFDQ